MFRRNSNENQVHDRRHHQSTRARYSPRGDNGNIGPRGRRQRDGGRRIIRSELGDRRYDLEQNRSVEINEFSIGVLYTFLRYIY